MKIEVKKTANYRILENGKTKAVIVLKKGIHDVPIITKNWTLTEAEAKELLKNTNHISKVTNKKE